MQKISSFIFISLLTIVLAVGGFGCTKKARMQKHLERADRYFAEGDYDQAELEYINALKLDQKSAAAFAQLGTIYFEQGRLGRAFYVFQQARTLDTNNLDLHMHLGQFDMAAGRPKDAMNEAYFVLSHRPLDENAPLLLADSVSTPQEFDAAVAYLQKLSVPPNRQAPIDVALGGLYYRNQDIKSAQAEWRKAKEADPKFGPLYTALGNYYWSEKQLKLADEAFKTSIESAPPRSPRRLKYIQFKLQTGDVEGGKHLLEETLKKAPDFIPAAVALAQLAAAEKNYDQANDLTKKVISRDEENFDAWMLQGRVAMLQNEPARAAALFDRMARSYSKSPQVFYQLGTAYSAAGDLGRATDSLNQALKLNPKFGEATIALAQVKIAKSELKSAVSLLEPLIKQRPDLGQAQLLLADAYRQQGNPEDALKVYDRLQANFPKSAEIPLLQGTIFMQLNRKTEARKAFERSLENSPGNLLALEQLTDLDINAKQFDAALQRIQKIIDANPKVPDPSLLVAKVYAAEPDLAKATATLSKQIELHPDFTAAYLMLAHMYTTAGQNQKAMETLRPLLAKQPDNPSALMQEAGIDEQLKDYKAAREAYEKLLVVNPKYSPALNNLAYLYADNNQLDKASEMAHKARELLPTDPATADTLGWILYRKGEYAQALPLLKESGAKIPSAEVQLHLGLAYYMTGNEEVARAWLQNAVQSKDVFPFKDDGSRSLAIIAINPKTAGPDAQTLLEKRVSDVPNDGVALSRLAAIYRRNGNQDKAIAAYEAALKANPQNEPALWELAQIYSTRPQQSAKAFELAKAAYKFNPDDPAIPRLLGRLAYLNGDYKWSVTLLENASKKQPDDRELALDLAESQYSTGQVSDAENSIHAVLKGSGNFSRADKAKRFLDMDALWNNPSQAIAASAQVDQVLKTDPDFVPALMAQGVIHEQKNELPAARDNFEKVLSRYPDFLPAKRHLAIIYSQTTTDGKKAYAMATKAREAYPDDSEVSKALGIILYREGDYARAAKLFNESKVQKNSDAQLLYYLGMAQYQLKQKTESKKTLLRAVDLKLPDNLAADAKKVLSELK